MRGSLLALLLFVISVAPMGCGSIKKVFGGEKVSQIASTTYEGGRSLIRTVLPIAVRQWANENVELAIAFVNETYEHMTAIKSARLNPAEFNRMGTISNHLALFARSLPRKEKSKRIDELIHKLNKYNAWGAFVPIPDITVSEEFDWKLWRDANLMMIGAPVGGEE